MNGILRLARFAIFTVALIVGLGGPVVARACASKPCCSPEGAPSEFCCACCCHTPACDCEIKTGDTSIPQASIAFSSYAWTALPSRPIPEFVPIPAPARLGVIPTPPEREWIRFGHSALHERAPPCFS